MAGRYLLTKLAVCPATSDVTLVITHLTVNTPVVCVINMSFCHSTRYSYYLFAGPASSTSHCSLHVLLCCYIRCVVSFLAHRAGSVPCKLYTSIQRQGHDSERAKLEAKLRATCRTQQVECEIVLYNCG